MVSALRRFRSAIADDWQGLLGTLEAGRSKARSPRLRSYRRGGRHLHLRIDADGRGVLFVDVTDALHLNTTAAAIAESLLDGESPARLRARLGAGLPLADRARIRDDVGQFEEFFVSLERGGCATCVPGFTRRALFSVPVQAPFKADLVLTYGCNNACSHCYNEPDRFDMPSLGGSEWRRVLERLAEIGVPHVIFTGGEATLHPELPELIAYAHRLGLVAGLNSNGRRLAAPGFAAELAAAGLDHVQITIASHHAEIHDRINNAPGAFAQTIRGVERAHAAGLHVLSNTTICNANADHVEEIVDFLAAQGLKTFAMNATIFSGGGFADPLAIPEESLAPILVRVRDRAATHGLRFLWYTPTEYCRMNPVELEIGAKRCNAGEYSFAVEPNGDVLPCQSFYVRAGNILRDPWESIWDGELFVSFRDREKLLGEAGLEEKCWTCPDLPLCGGGCRIEREARLGRRTAEPILRFAGPALPGFTPAIDPIKSAVRSSGRPG